MKGVETHPYYDRDTGKLATSRVLYCPDYGTGFFSSDYSHDCLPDWSDLDLKKQHDN